MNLKIKPLLSNKPIYQIRKSFPSFNIEASIDYLNQRIIVKKYHIKKNNDFFTYLNKLAKKENLTKIITYTKENDLELFLKYNLVVEAVNPYYFHGQPMYYLSKFLTEERKNSTNIAKKEKIIKQSTNKKEINIPCLQAEYSLKPATKKDIPQLINLYKNVFKTYPTPIYNSEYIAKIMDEETANFMVITDKNNKIVSAASADIDKENLCAEITDCATYPQYRGHNFMYHLTKSLEAILEEKKFKSVYTLARAGSIGINKVFSRNKYKYFGRLVKNCHICGNYEDMNLWVKLLKNF